MDFNDYILVVDGNTYLMKDEYEENFNFHYNLGFIMPKNNLDSFNQAILKLNTSLCNKLKLNPNSNISEIFKVIKNNNDFKTIINYANILCKIGFENDVKLVRSNDHKLFLEKTENMTPKLQDYIISTNIIAVFHEACKCLSQKFKLKDTFIQNLLFDKKLEKYVEKEFSDFSSRAYFDSSELELTNFTSAISILNNLTIESSNRKLYQQENYTENDKSMLDLWATRIFKLFYDKYENVRDAANEITNFIMQLKDIPSDFDEINDDN